MMIKLSFMSPVMRQFTCVEIANLSIICLGMSVVWGSPMVIKLADPEQTVLSEPITENQTAWIVSMSLLSGLIAVLVNGFFIDHLGRMNTLLISYVPRTIFCFISLFATEYWMILVARAFAGVADVLSLTTLSTYSSEISGKAIRGATGTMTQINSAVGMLIMFGVGPFVSYFAMHILMLCIVFAAFIPLLFLPESPLFLYTKGKTKKSLEVLTFLYGTEEAAHEEMKEYSSNTDNDNGVNKLQFFKDRIVIKTLVIVIFMIIGMQLSGYNIMNVYLQTIMESVNTSVSSEISSLIIGVIQLIACACAFFLTKRFARITLLCTSLAVMFVGMVGLATFFTLEENGVQVIGFLNYLPLISVGIVIFGCNAGLGSLLWVLVAELFYGPVRGYGMSICAFVMSITTFLLTLVFPTLIAVIGTSGTYWIFATGCALACAYIALLVPETKNRTFAEIQTALGRRESTVKA